MILTTCAACAAPLENKWFRCGICKTRYCGQTRQKLHWKKGGHKALCPQIKSGGGAEQYHADKKYKEAVAVAVKKCAADTKGQTCYICSRRRHARRFSSGRGDARGHGTNRATRVRRRASNRRGD